MECGDAPARATLPLLGSFLQSGYTAEHEVLVLLTTRQWLEHDTIFQDVGEALCFEVPDGLQELVRVVQKSCEGLVLKHVVARLVNGLLGAEAHAQQLLLQPLEVHSVPGRLLLQDGGRQLGAGIAVLELVSSFHLATSFCRRASP